MNEADPTEEAAAIHRLATAGTRTKDSVVTAVVGARAIRLIHTTGMDISDPTVAKLLGLDQIPPNLRGEED